MEKELKELMADIFNVPEEEILKESSPNTLAGWDSLKHLVLVNAIEESFNVSLTTDEVTSIMNVKNIIDILNYKGVR